MPYTGDIEKRRASVRKYHKNHAAELSEYHHDYRQEHKAELNEYHRLYRSRRKFLRYSWTSTYTSREDVIQKAVERWRRRRHAAMGLEYNLTEDQWNETMYFFDNSCIYCGSPGPIQRDHIIPMDDGGGYVKWNMGPACETCNKSKGPKEMIPWYTSQPFFSQDRLNKILNFVAYYSEKEVKE